MKIFNGNITQLNTGKLEGKLFNTFNCDLTFDKGNMSIAPRTLLTTDTIANMDTPTAFKQFDTKWFTVAGRVLMNDGTPEGVFSADTSTGVPTTTLSSAYTDMAVFGSVLLVSATDQLYSKVTNSGNGTGAYTSRRSFGAGTTTPHMLCIYNNRAYWVDTRGQIFSMDTTYTSAVTTGTTYTFLVPDGHDVLWMRADSSGIFIGTLDPNGGNAFVYKWDGVTANKWSGRWGVASQAVLAGYITSEGVLTIVTSNARILQFTGNGFQQIGRFPIKRNLLYKANALLSNDRFIHPNGISEIRGYLCFLINSRENSTTNVSYRVNIHSGIWEFDGTSLYHKYSLSYKSYSGSITDYGQVNINIAGGLAGISDAYTTADSAKGNFLAGASYYTTSSTSTGLGYGIWTDDYYDTFEKSGWFSTQEIAAEHYEEMFNTIATIYSPTSGINFIVKYRTADSGITKFNGTWLSTSLFSSSQAIVAGDEITILQGRGAGRVAHASSVSGSYNVTLDEVITGVTTGSTFVARKESWKKIGTISNTNRRFQTSAINQPGTKLELKVAMLGTGEINIEDLILDNKINQ